MARIFSTTLRDKTTQEGERDLVDLTGEPLPHGLATTTEDERTQHHRKLLYVAATRAKERLALLELLV
jgi:ATP-dependent exoDNAse (exonuclease V) beta subunit